MKADPTDPKLGTTVAERYKLEERLGAGGMGVVYRGTEVDGGGRVAVKFLHEAFAGVPDLVKRFNREVAAMSRVRHASLITILDSGVSAGVPYLVMEFFQGRVLAEVLERGALPPVRAVRIAQKVLAGVAAAHDSGVVHRDLKPDNILVSGSGADEKIKILDFGLAKMVHGSGVGQTQLTNTGFALGTPAYMAPEQAKGAPTDHRADIYAIGVVLYHMVVGRKPFISDSPMAVMRMHMDDPPMPPRKAAPDLRLSAALERVILKAMAKDPTERFGDAEAFSRALAATPEGGGREATIDEAEADEPEDATTYGKKSTPKPQKAKAKPKKKRRLALPFARTVRGWIVQGVLLVGVAGVGFWGWTKLSRHERQQVRRTLDSAVDQAKGAVGKAKDALRSVADNDPRNAHPDVAGKPDKPEPPHDIPAPNANDHNDDDDDDDKPPVVPRDTPGARLEAASPQKASPQKVTLKSAVRLYAMGKTDDAIEQLYQLRKRTPKSPEIALWLGHAYFRKVWRTDGLREYDDALDARPAWRKDPMLIRNAVAALDDPTYKLARALVRKRIGAAALPELRRAAKSRDAKVAARASRLVAQLGGSGGGARKRRR